MVVMTVMVVGVKCREPSIQVKVMSLSVRLQGTRERSEVLSRLVRAKTQWNTKELLHPREARRDSIGGEKRYNSM